MLAACAVPGAQAFNDGNDLAWLAPPVAGRPARDARLHLPPERLARIQESANPLPPRTVPKPAQALVRAAASGDLAGVRALLDGGVNPNVDRVWLDAPLLAAVRGDQVELVQLLLDRGARADVKIAGETPLARAVKHGNRVLVQALLAAGADPDRRGDDGDTAVHSAVRLARPELIALLARGRPDLRLFDREGLTALGLAASTGQTGAAQALIDAGAALELSDRQRHPALWHAFSSGDFDMARLLLKNGAKPGGMPVEVLN